VHSAEASIKSDNSLVALVDVELDRPANVYIEYGNEDAGWFRTAITDAPLDSHTVPVLRLRAESRYDFTIFAVDENGAAAEGPSGQFTTGSLPEALSTLRVTTEGRPTPDLLLADLRDAGGTFLTMMDQGSQIVWYFQTPSVVPGEGISSGSIEQRVNYNLVHVVGFGNNPCCLREVTPLGEMVDQLAASLLDGSPHHDFVILSDHEIAYLSDVTRIIDDTANGGNAMTSVVGESIRIWDQSTGTTREVWNSFNVWDVTDPAERVQWTGDPVRWVHGNSFDVGPRGSFIISSRNRNQIFSISSDFQRIDWQLGGPNSDFDFANPEDQFFRQHNPSQLPNGNILLFDNGAGRPEELGGEYSRALELLLDDYDGVAQKIWEFRAEPDIYSRNISSAIRLDNGNTLINFGNREDTSTMPVTAVEVTRGGEVVWKIEVLGPSFQNRFRMTPLQSVMGETRLE
jgi:hypothetical protein